MAKQEKLTTPVVFFSKEHANTTFLVRRNTVDYKGKLPFDEAPIRPDDIVARFDGGMCTTYEPEVVEYLSNKKGIWRSNDTLGPMKMEYGEEVVTKFLKAFGMDVIDSNALSEALGAAGIGSIVEREDAERAATPVIPEE